MLLFFLTGRLEYASAGARVAFSVRRDLRQRLCDHLLQRGSYDLRHGVFSTPDQQVTAHIDNINDHEQEQAVAPFIRDTFHSASSSGMRFSITDGLAVSTVPMANLVSRTMNSLKSVGQQFLRAALVQFGGGGSEDLVAVLLDIFAGDFCQFSGDKFVAFACRWVSAGSGYHRADRPAATLQPRVEYQ